MSAVRRTLARSVRCTLYALALVAAPAEAQFALYRLLPQAPAVEAIGSSTQVDVSANGRSIVFTTTANNWFAGQQPGDRIIVADLVTDALESASRTSAGTPLNGNASGPVASADARYIAFTSQANNLDVGTPTSGAHVVRKDRSSGQLLLVSASAAGTPAAGSAGGQARYASISGDGRFVVFSSDASNLVAGDLPGTEDIFVKDLDTGAIEAVSRDINGAFTSAGVAFQTSHSISADGRWVLFQSSAANLVAGVGGGVIQVYLRDLQTGSTELVSRSTAGVPAGSQSDVGAISPSGRFVSFRSFATNLDGAAGSGVYIRDRIAATTVSIPKPVVDGVAANTCRESDVSDAGTVILACVFPSPIADQVVLHVPGSAGTPFLISSDANDVRGNAISGASVAVDASGLSMVFESLASNLSATDGNGESDVFVLIALEFLERIFRDGFED